MTPLMRTGMTAMVAVALMAVSPSAQRPPANTLNVYVVDVEGGNATLFVSPSGESLLIDTGNGGAGAARDADRIVEAMRDAGIQRLDHLVITHYHGDHIGGLSELAARVPIQHFIDHGPNVQPGPNIDPILRQYEELHAKARHTVVRPGDRIPVSGMEVRVVTSAGEAIKTPLPGAGSPNPYCASFKPHAVNPVSGQPVGNSEDEQSVGSHITFGSFRAVYLGDLTWNKEFELMCPNNRLGIVDLFVVSRHGQPSSNSEALVHAIRPRVTITNNGIRKGGQPDAMRVFLSAPRLENLWQLHFSFLGGQEYTVPGLFIANTETVPMPLAAAAPPQPGAQAPPAPAHDGQAFWIKVSAQMDGAFSVTNSRNGFTKTYGVVSGTR